jgi:hypothetical protein
MHVWACLGWCARGYWQHPLRDSTTSTGFKRAVYRAWFCDELPERGAGWIRCVHLRKQGVNAMRFGPSKQQRSQRVCQLCTMNCVDDEYHVFECPAQAFADLRAQYPLLSSLPHTTTHLIQRQLCGNAWIWRRSSNGLNSRTI